MSPIITILCAFFFYLFIYLFTFKLWEVFDTEPQGMLFEFLGSQNTFSLCTLDVTLPPFTMVGIWYVYFGLLRIFFTLCSCSSCWLSDITFRSVPGALCTTLKHKDSCVSSSFDIDCFLKVVNPLAYYFL